MCKFVCTIPEQHLAGRQIQIEYIKAKTPKLARIPWQAYDPCNLYNYHNFNSIPSYLFRFGRKVNNRIKKIVIKEPLIHRNWEIQFLGKKNDEKLVDYLFNNNSFKELLPENIVERFYRSFKEKDHVWYSHPVSMLLTLSLFSKRQFMK
jgi:hypothetical protein